MVSGRKVTFGHSVQFFYIQEENEKESRQKYWEYYAIDRAHFKERVARLGKELVFKCRIEKSRDLQGIKVDQSS